MNILATNNGNKILCLLSLEHTFKLVCGNININHITALCKNNCSPLSPDHLSEIGCFFSWFEFLLISYILFFLDKIPIILPSLYSIFSSFAGQIKPKFWIHELNNPRPDIFLRLSRRVNKQTFNFCW